MTIDLTKIGMSDLATIVGLNPYQKPIDLVQRIKHGVISEETRAMERGHRFESAVLREWELETGGKLLGPRAIDMPAYPFLRANIDSEGERDGETVVVEAKTANWRTARRWDDGELPQENLCQAHGYIWAAGRERCDVVGLLGGCEVRIVTVLADRDLEEMLIDAAARFHRDHIVGDALPPIDGSESYSDFLKAKFPAQRLPLIIATPPVDELLASYRDAISAADDATERVEKMKNELKSLIGDGEGISSRVGSVLWRNNKEFTRTDWAALATELGPTQEQIAKFTTTSPGPRVFRFTPKKQPKGAA